tara:strand:- start:1597 stop:1926 length:330 start_codon:yes stop_codon:yes gene_type:complete
MPLSFAGLFHKYFLADHFQCRRASDHSLSSENLLTLRTGGELLSEVLSYAFDKTFNKRALAAFAVFVEFSATLRTMNIHGANGSLFVRFSHAPSLKTTQPSLPLSGAML